MKKLDCSISSLVSGIAVLFLIFVISNSCTKSVDEIIPGKPVPSGFRVSIGGGFSPVEIKISAGDTIIWINNSQEIESVTSDDGLFEGILRTNESYRFKFVSIGTYTYYSRMHPGMNGEVVVN